MSIVKRAYRYRFYPTNTQEDQLSRTFGCVRYVYNHFLRLRSDKWKEEKEHINYAKSSRLLTELKRMPDTVWLYEVPNVCLQQSLRNLDVAFKNFFKKHARYPTFKNRNSTQAAKYTRSGFSYRDGKIKLARQNKPLKINMHRELPGDPISCTVTRDPSGRYYISILVEEEIQTFTAVKKEVGLDLGLTHLLITSDGKKIHNHRYYRTLQKRLRRAQKRFCRQIKGSNNRRKQRKKVARINTRIADQRNDFAHKLTTQLVRENQVIAAESLQVKNMIRNRSLAKSIADAGWFQIIRMLTYKSEWYGRTFLQVDKFFPSSKQCSQCGAINDNLKLSDRHWTCAHCNKKHDRDINAAINILAAAKDVIRPDDTA